MPSFREQIERTRKAHEVSNALESVSRLDIANIFDGWDRGEYSAMSVRWALERVIRNSYRSSAALASAHMQQASEIPEWTPVEVFNNEYLQNLISDVRRNLREYKASDRDEKARRRAILRMQHSAGVAVQRGFSDGMIAAAEELEDFGVRVRKMWRANFVNNIPCEFCTALHGKEVGITESFREKENALKIYGDLKGPPRHPRCRCYLVMLIVTLENAFDVVDSEVPVTPPMSMTTEDVQRMPISLFASIIQLLKKTITFIARKFIGQ